MGMRDYSRESIGWHTFELLANPHTHFGQFKRVEMAPKALHKLGKKIDLKRGRKRMRDELEKGDSELVP